MTREQKVANAVKAELMHAVIAVLTTIVRQFGPTEHLDLMLQHAEKELAVLTRKN